jgi:Ca2+-transporting ATPase
VLAGLLTIGFEYALGIDNDVEHARALAIGALIASGAAMTAALSALKNRAAVLSVTASLASLVLLVQVPELAALMHLAPLHGADWGTIGAVAALTGLLAWRIKAQLESPRGAAAGLQR